jgi:hypothetical protein
MPDEAPPRSGRPRLTVAPSGGHARADGPEALGYEVEFPLLDTHASIGSAEGQDIRLDGLAPEHAVIEWLPDGDEYIFRPLRADGTARVDGNITVTGLHHGDRINLGRWTLIFQRDEYADHVRHGRARQGGQYTGGGVTSAGGHEPEHG